MRRAIGCLCIAVCAFGVPALATARADDSTDQSPVLIAIGATTIFADGSVAVAAGAETNAFNACPQGWVCLWSNPQFLGEMIAFRDRAVWLNLGAYGFNDDAESWRNRTGDDAKLAKHATGNANFPGQVVCLDNNSSSPSLGGFNNDASAIRITNGANIC